MGMRFLAQRGSGKARAEADSGGYAVPDVVIYRLHWLLFDDNTYRGWRSAGLPMILPAGTRTPGVSQTGLGQVLRPLGGRVLLELPCTFRTCVVPPKAPDLSESAALSLCESFMLNAILRVEFSRVLWHDRSHASRGFWGDFYVRLLHGAEVIGCLVRERAETGLLIGFARDREWTFQARRYRKRRHMVEPRGAGSQDQPTVDRKGSRPGLLVATLDERGHRAICRLA